MLEIIRLALAIIISIIIFMLLKTPLEKEKLRRFVGVKKKLYEKSNTIRSYEKLDVYMSKNGVYAMFEGVTPSHFVIAKMVFGLAFSLIGLEMGSIIIGLGAFALGYCIPKVIIKVSNNEDNEKIIIDLKEIYDTLRIQAKAGVYLTDSLSECYLVARSKRLKKALMELNVNIIANKDIEQALIEFDKKFNCNYIDTFTTVIIQSLESGQTVQILEDLSEQIADIQEVINIKQKRRIENKITLIGMLMFVGILSIVLYGLFTELISMLSSF